MTRGEANSEVWARVEPLRDDAIKAANLFHATAFVYVDGRVMAECGHVLADATETVTTNRGHWPDGYSCMDCINVVKTRRGPR
jgi:hypothetical protein